MIRFVFAILLALLAGACGQGVPGRDARPPRPALWVIETGTGTPAGWLFGTIHALPDETEWGSPALAAAEASAGVLVVEVRDLDPRRTATIFARLASDEPVPPLAQRLPPATRRGLGAAAARAGLDTARLDRLETWAVALALARAAGSAPTANGADQAMIARFAGRPIVELESAAEQLAIFDGLPEGDQQDLLGAVLAEGKDPDADARMLAEAWLAGDLARLDKVTRRGLLADPALYKALLTDRNTAWLAMLGPLLAGGRRPLVAVGTAHMLGPEGLPALLAAQGYRVRRIQ